MHACHRHLARAARHRAARAFTLIELMVVIAIIGVVLVLAGPPMIDMLGMQRMKAVNSQLVSDFQYARSEAVSRNQFIGISFHPTDTDTVPRSCYVIFASGTDPLSWEALRDSRPACDCRRPVGSACTGTAREIRTVQLPAGSAIDFRFHTTQWEWVAFAPRTGGMRLQPSNVIKIEGNEFCAEVRRTPRGRLRAGINLAGRPTVCTPDNSVPGVPTCPPFVSSTRNCRVLPA